MIYLNSRYVNGVIANAVDARDGQIHKFVLRRWPINIRTQSYTVYTWMEGDRLDIVAQHYFSDPTHYWKILDANPSILDPMSLTPGQQIRIPTNG